MKWPGSWNVSKVKSMGRAGCSWMCESQLALCVSVCVCVYTHVPKYTMVFNISWCEAVDSGVYWGDRGQGLWSVWPARYLCLYVVCMCVCVRVFFVCMYLERIHCQPCCGLELGSWRCSIFTFIELLPLTPDTSNLISVYRAPTVLLLLDYVCFLVCCID